MPRVIQGNLAEWVDDLLTEFVPEDDSVMLAVEGQREWQCIRLGPHFPSCSDLYAKTFGQGPAGHESILEGGLISYEMMICF